MSEYTTKFGKQNVNDWDYLNRFESKSKAKNSHVLFCGGPIRTLAWVPFSTKEDHQYLAISCESNKDSPYLHNSTPSQTCLQMWRMGIEDESMQLRYIVALDNGPIRCTAFCPSGGCDPATNRMSIVAIPTVSGDIHVLGLPSPDESGIPMGATLRIAPSLVLKSGNQSGQVTCIAWSKVISINTYCHACEYSWFNICNDILDQRPLTYCRLLRNRCGYHLEFGHPGQCHVREHC